MEYGPLSKCYMPPTMQPLCHNCADDKSVAYRTLLGKFLCDACYLPKVKDPDQGYIQAFVDTTKPAFETVFECNRCSVKSRKIHRTPVGTLCEACKEDYDEFKNFKKKKKEKLKIKPDKPRKVVL